MVFGDCTLEELDETFNLEPLIKLAVLEAWLNQPGEILDQERNYLLTLQKYLTGQGICNE